MIYHLAYQQKLAFALFFIIILTTVADNARPLDFPTLLSLVEICNTSCRIVSCFLNLDWQKSSMYFVLLLPVYLILIGHIRIPYGNVSKCPVYLHSHVSISLTDVLQAEILVFRNHASLISVNVTSTCINRRYHLTNIYC